MKTILIITVLSAFLFTSFITINKANERQALISAIVEHETDIAKARCFCRIGNDRGSRVNDYPNAYKDLGTLKTYRGINPVNQKNDDDCGRICSAAALNWANSQTFSNLCNYFKESGPQSLVAYSKVGGKKWNVRQTVKEINCCNSGGTIICPRGSHSEHKNFPGYCAVHLCAPSVKGDRRIYNQDGSPWGYIYKDQMYQLIKGTVSGAGWTTCN